MLTRLVDSVLYWFDGNSERPLFTPHPASGFGCGFADGTPRVSAFPSSLSFET